MRKIYLIPLVLLMAVCTGQAQTLEQAQKLMQAYNYSKAVKVLEKLAQKDATKNEALPLLGECYYQQKNYAGMRSVYSQAISLPNLKPEEYLYYGIALQSGGDYQKAKQMFAQYIKLNPSDKRGQLLEASCDSIMGPWKNAPPLFDVKNAKNVNTSYSDFGPAMYANGFTFCCDKRQDLLENNKYKWTGNYYLDIFFSEPKNKGDFFGDMSAPSSMRNHFNQEYHDGPAAFAKNDELAFITRTYKDKAQRKDGFRTNLLKMFYSEKVSGNWGEFKPFFLNNDNYSVGHPALSPDGNTLYFVSDMPGGLGGTDIYVCTRQGEGWSTPKNLGEPVNTPGDEMFPSLAPDGSLYFSSNTLPGYGGLDLFKSRQINGTWTTPANLKSPANSSYDDFAIAWASNMQTGLFSSDRPGGAGLDDIYAFNKLPEPVIPKPEIKKPMIVSGLVKDKTNLQPLANATVFFWNKCNGKIVVLKTDKDGKYTIPVEEACNYLVKAVELNYIPDCETLSLDKFEPGKEIAVRDLLLDKLLVTKTWKINNIYYDFDKSFIRMDAKPELDKLVGIMKDNPISVELGSHCDRRGSFEYNDKLSQRRAEAAVKYIVAQGIDPGRITAKGYGKRQPVVCLNGAPCTEAEHQLNRRTEFTVTDLKVPVPENEQFNGSKYKAGEVLDIKSLPPDFFQPCK